jgi:hypothetical protein
MLEELETLDMNETWELMSILVCKKLVNANGASW